jgi:hypothetical protein
MSVSTLFACSGFSTSPFVAPHPDAPVATHSPKMVNCDEAGRAWWSVLTLARSFFLRTTCLAKERGTRCVKSQAWLGLSGHRNKVRILAQSWNLLNEAFPDSVDSSTIVRIQRLLLVGLLGARHDAELLRPATKQQNKKSLAAYTQGPPCQIRWLRARQDKRKI